MSWRRRLAWGVLAALLAEVAGLLAWAVGHLSSRLALGIGPVVLLLVLIAMQTWYSSFPVRACQELPKLMSREMRKEERIRLRRLSKGLHTWSLAFRCPMGVTASGFIQHRESIETALNCSVRVWEDGGLVRMRFGVKPLPSVVPYSSFVQNPGHGELPIPVGDSREGKLWPDLVQVKNLLIGGAIGGGKSTVLNAIITWLAEHFSPHEVQFVLFDLKGGDGVEFGLYNPLPHMFCPVVTRLEQVEAVLEELLADLEWRYQLFHAAGVKKLEDYNRLPAEAKTVKGMPVSLPRKLVVVDEFAEIWGLGKAAGPVIARFESLARLGRAAGDHLILATQRPSVDVVPGQIRNNFLATVAFYCGDEHSSGVLLGPGDFRAHTLDPDSPGLAIWKHRTSSKVRTVWLSAEEAQERVNRIAGGITVQALPQVSVDEAPEPEALEEPRALRVLQAVALVPQLLAGRMSSEWNG